MSATTDDQLSAVLGEIDALRDTLLERRRTSPYLWDPAPIHEYNSLLERARSVLPGEPVDLPNPLAEPAPGQQLWRTPTDDALDALENLRAAVTSALKA